jgi:hypothetical protein
MPITPSDFWNVADALQRGGGITGEPCSRTVAGRAYYSAYLATREALRHQYGDPSFDVQHAMLAQSLANHGDPEVKEIGVKLGTMHILRNRSDYHLASHIRQYDALLSVRESRRVLDLLGNVAGRFPVVPRKP